MPTPPSVAVFCGSRFGSNPAHAEAAEAVGRGLAEAGIRLIYGGGEGCVRHRSHQAHLAAGGAVHGVIPRFLQNREVMHDGVEDLLVTESMHSRKQRMFEAADAFLVLPGGLGTFDELFEILTWRQLGLHDKPILIVDVQGWAQALIATVDRAVADGFADPSVRALFEHLPDAPAALARLAGLGRTRSPVHEGDPAML